MYSFGFTEGEARGVPVLPDPSCNREHGSSRWSALMQGLDGIENKIDPGQPLQISDISDLGSDERRRVPSMLGSLESVPDCLARIYQFLPKRWRLHRRDATPISITSGEKANAMRFAAASAGMSSKCTMTFSCKLLKNNNVGLSDVAGVLGRRSRIR